MKPDVSMLVTILATGLGAPFKATHEHVEGGLYEVLDEFRLHIGENAWNTGVRYRNERGVVFARSLENFNARMRPLHPMVEALRAQVAGKAETKQASALDVAAQLRTYEQLCALLLPHAGEDRRTSAVGESAAEVLERLLNELKLRRADSEYDAVAGRKLSMELGNPCLSVGVGGTLISSLMEFAAHRIGRLRSAAQRARSALDEVAP